MYQKPTSSGRRLAPVKLAGFTLLELIVVIGIIAVLASLLLPVLARAKSRGKSVTCLNHQRQLAIACMVYVDDYQDTMPYNMGETEIREAVAADSFMNWNSTILSWELDSDNTNTALLVRGGLGAYVSGSIQSYRCPSDTVVSDIQANSGWKTRVRSYSMNAMVGNAGAFSATGANQNNPAYRQFFRVSQMPRPSEMFVFIEEHPDSINDGYFLNRFYSYKWSELPASWHNGAANMTFGDGHAESHRWQHGSTQPPSLPDAAGLPIGIPQEQLEDYDWLMTRTSVRAY